MSSLLESTRNSRYLCGGQIPSMRYIRSDVPAELTENDIRWLADNGFDTVIDLRSPEEASQKPCPLQSLAQFRYFTMPVTGGNAIPDTPDEVPESYVRMLDAQMRAILELAETAPHGVLFFCNAGKDRTGVVSAMLLRRVGASDAEMIEDYVLSADNLREMLEAYAKQVPTADIEVITPKAEYMKRFLCSVRKLEISSKFPVGIADIIQK